MYSDSLTITRNSDTGTSSTITGLFTPTGEPLTIYEDAVDAQDIKGGLQYKGPELMTKNADLELYLKDEAKIYDIQVGDKGVLTRGGYSQDVSVIKLRVLDGAIECNISGDFVAPVEETFSLLMESGERLLLESADFLLKN